MYDDIASDLHIDCFWEGGMVRIIGPRRSQKHTVPQSK